MVLSGTTPEDLVFGSGGGGRSSPEFLRQYAPRDPYSDELPNPTAGVRRALRWSNDAPVRGIVLYTGTDSEIAAELGRKEVLEVIDSRTSDTVHVAIPHVLPGPLVTERRNEFGDQGVPALAQEAGLCSSESALLKGVRLPTYHYAQTRLALWSHDARALADQLCNTNLALEARISRTREILSKSGAYQRNWTVSDLEDLMRGMAGFLDRDVKEIKIKAPCLILWDHHSDAVADAEVFPLARTGRPGASIVELTVALESARSVEQIRENIRKVDSIKLGMEFDEEFRVKLKDYAAKIPWITLGAAATYLLAQLGVVLKG